MRPPPLRNVVAQEMRAVLARVFPGTKFSVRQKPAARLCCFAVTWTGGPSEDDVKREIGSLPRSVPFGSLYCARYSEPPR